MYFFVLGNTILEPDGIHFQDINKAYIYNLTVILPRIQEGLILTQYLLHPVLTEMWKFYICKEIFPILFPRVTETCARSKVCLLFC